MSSPKPTQPKADADFAEQSVRCGLANAAFGKQPAQQPAPETSYAFGDMDQQPQEAKGAIATWRSAYVQALSEREEFKAELERVKGQRDQLHSENKSLTSRLATVADARAVAEDQRDALLAALEQVDALAYNHTKGAMGIAQQIARAAIAAVEGEEQS